jgi:hypothetical protein
LSAAVGAALLAMAVAAAPAMASPTVLCEVNEEPCSKANYKSLPQIYGAVFENEKTEARLLLPELSPVTCGTGKMVTTFGAEPAEPLLGEGWINFGLCSGGCEIGEINDSGSIEATGKGNGLLTIKEPVLQLTCGFMKCRFGTTAMKVEVQGGEVAMLFTTTKLTLKEKGFLCPTTATYDGIYEDHLESPTYVVHG